MTPQRQAKSQLLLGICIHAKTAFARIPRPTASAASGATRTNITEMKARRAINTVPLNVHLSWAKTAL